LQANKTNVSHSFKYFTKPPSGPEPLLNAKSLQESPDRLLTAPTRSKNDGRYASPQRLRGICSSISPTRVSQGREVVVAVLLRMDEQIRRLEARVEKLERKLKKSSRNSSRPPSSDPLSSPPRSKDASSAKGAAPSPATKATGRELLPVWAVDEVIDHWPKRCPCGHVFSEHQRGLLQLIEQPQLLLQNEGAVERAVGLLNLGQQRELL
jgi:hypothetical protein